MKGIEDKFWRFSKKVRNKLIYYTYLDIKKKSINKNGLLINSMTSNELNNKYQECSDYCVQKIETYTSSPMNNGIDYNYFHVSLTYNSLNNNYHMLVDNKNIDQYIGHNNIVGKYYKGNTIQIGTTTDKIKYNISLNENRFEKKIIGEKKFKKQLRNSSPLDLTKSILILEEENNNNEINFFLDNIKSNNDNNYKNLIKDNINTEKVKDNYRNIITKNTQKLINKYMIKLKKYCSNLIKMDIRISSKSIIPNKITEPPSPVNKRKNKNNKNNYGSDKEKPKIIEDPLILNSNKDIININLNIISENKNYPHKKLKSQTKIHHNIFKFQTKRSLRKHKSNTLNKNEEIARDQKQNTPKKIYSPKKQKSPKKIFSPKKQPSPKKIYSSKKQSPKKIYSPKKQYSPKKIYSPKNISSPKKKLSRKDNIFEFNSGPVIPTSKFFQKFKKEKTNDTSGSIKNDFPTNRNRINTIKCNGYSKFNPNNEKNNINNLRGSNNNNIKKGRLKKSLTINKMFKFKAGELLGKKINNVKIKDNNKY